MKTSLFATMLIAVAMPLHAEPRINLAEDAASDGAYSSGWKTGDNGGSGFAGWVLQTSKAEGDQSFAGFFIANASQQPIPAGVGISDKAFGVYANGSGFESACAFRTFNKALAVGDSFSLFIASSPIEKKNESDDPGLGAIGFTMRSGSESKSCDDYNKGARFEFGRYEGQDNYQIYDGETDHDTGMPCVEGGVTVTITLATADTYDLEITTMADKKTKKLPTRKLGGTEGSSLESVCVFNRDGEKSDGFFNGFQISRESK